jgi:hypothetical protein
VLDVTAWRVVDERGDSGFVYVDRGPSFDYLQVEPVEHAALIAAAPDLLNAAKLALTIIEGLEHQTSESIDGNLLRAAIAKAEGR